MPGVLPTKPRARFISTSSITEANRFAFHATTYRAGIFPAAGRRYRRHRRRRRLGRWNPPVGLRAGLLNDSKTAIYSPADPAGSILADRLKPGATVKQALAG